jgi:hypothetical protein
MMAEDPLTDLELAFRELLQRPGELHEWAARCRLAWERTPAGKAAVARCYRTIGGFRQDAKPARKGAA